ncbi:hypothetical protein JCM11491_005760 [Sporobolomyces phaffii]
MLLRLSVAALSVLAAAPSVDAWGFAGHSIVATIAEIHLHPSVLAYVRSGRAALLPEYAHGHLAPVASWPDRIRMVPEYRGWSGELHYASVVGDHPPEVCAWPQDDGTHEVPVGVVGTADEGQGWKNEHDVLHAIANYTTRLESNTQDWEALRFLVHFIGDAHQPMHLTNRERGGNGDPVRWEGRRANLHGLWDNLLLARKLREQTNYTRPLPSRQIESALTGAIYDPLIRLLLWEGVRTWWRTSLPEWLACPEQTAQSSTTRTRLGRGPDQLTFSSAARSVGGRREESRLESIVCPVHWAAGTHRVTCELAFPPGYDEHANPPVEVGGNTPYYRAIADSLTIERLLTQAGLRLAATLNTIFKDAAAAAAEVASDVQERGPLNLSWMDDEVDESVEEW